MTIWTSDAPQADTARTDRHVSAVMRSLRGGAAAVADFLISQELQPGSETEKLMREWSRRRR